MSVHKLLQWTTSIRLSLPAMETYPDHPGILEATRGTLVILRGHTHPSRMACRPTPIPKIHTEVQREANPAHRWGKYRLSLLILCVHAICKEINAWIGKKDEFFNNFLCKFGCLIYSRKPDCRLFLSRLSRWLSWSLLMRNVLMLLDIRRQERTQIVDCTDKMQTLADVLHLVLSLIRYTIGRGPHRSRYFLRFSVFREVCLTCLLEGMP